MERIAFPFSAVVGQERMKTALLVNAVDPGIGGVLVRGQKGTAKSTIVRALAGLLPDIDVVDGCPFHCDPDDVAGLHPGCRQRLENDGTLPRARRPMPLVDLPLSATEDRLAGSLQVEAALRDAERRFEPGLLAAAHRGILYVDEVNLLEDHLVDTLLDVAASGVNVVEREGISFTHAARFLLVGTMNPEEGELRPQFLDRFGLCVRVAALTHPAERRDIVRRRLEFDRDPQALRKRFAPQEEILRNQIVQARGRVQSVDVPDDIVDRAVRISLDLDAHGHRSDIAVLKTARALAALLEKEAVGVAEFREAARLALPHRVGGGPLGGAKGAVEQVEQALRRDETEGGLPDSRSETSGETRPATEPVSEAEETWETAHFEDSDMDVPGAAAASSMLFAFLKKKALNP